MKLTSRVFATWKALFDLLDSQDWPNHPTINEAPPVIFGDTNTVIHEAIVVVGTPISTDAAFEQATNRSHDETFVLQVIVGTKAPGLERDAVFARIEELCDVVQAALRTPEGKLTNTFNGASPTNPVEGVIEWQVIAIRTQMRAQAEGFGAFAEIDIRFKVRI